MSADSPVNKISHKQVVVVLVMFVFFSGVVFSLGNYYKSAQGHVAGEVEVNYQIITPADYARKINELFKGYLILGSDQPLYTEDFLERTKNIKQELLVVRVPTELMEDHKNIILALTAIENGLAKKDTGAMVEGIGELRGLVNKF